MESSTKTKCLLTHKSSTKTVPLMTQKSSVKNKLWVTHGILSDNLVLSYQEINSENYRTCDPKASAKTK
jgi:hypothetical protein